MFESIAANLKSQTNKGLAGSVETLKEKRNRLSETFSSIKSSIVHKTNSLSSYLYSDFPRSDSVKACSTPNLGSSELYNKPTQSYFSRDKYEHLISPRVKSDFTLQCIEDNDIGDVDCSIVDKFILVINADDGSTQTPRFRRRNDREEIRRRLATGCDTDEYYGGDRPGKKPSLQARLQSGMNLQICFMNETMSDTESPGSDTEPSSAVASPIKIKSNPEPPRSLNLSNKCIRSGSGFPMGNGAVSEADFFARQARLQAEARVALAQAKDMAHMQMEIERQRRQASPITDMLRASLHKVGVHFPEERRRLSRQMLTDMNLAQLQVIVNDLHTQIEYLNDSLVKFLMERDDLHMSQDSMLVDIEDLTRYLGAKETTLRDDVSQNNNNNSSSNNNNNNNNNIVLSSTSSSKPKINRLVKK